MILVCGGDADPNLRRLLNSLLAGKHPHQPLLAGARSHPRITWDVNEDRLTLDDTVISPDGCFIRYDVFSNLADGESFSAYRASAWYSTIQAWLDAHPQVRAFNRNHRWQSLKPHILCLARDAGLEIPRTLVTNDLGLLDSRQAIAPLVTKPVNGGDYCQELGPLLKTTARKANAASAPAIVQTRLVPPEIRVYRVGPEFFGFRVEANALDYRTTPDCRVFPHRDLPQRLLHGLRLLTDTLGLDFAAADFKTCPQTRRLLFLEINSGPMFVAFDAAGDGCLTRAITRFLAAPPAKRRKDSRQIRLTVSSV